MHEVAEAGPGAFSHLVLTAASFTKVGDWRQLSINWTPTKPAIVELLSSSFSIFFTTEFDVNVADQMIAEVVANVHLLNLAVFVLELDKDVFKEVVIMFLHLFV